MPQITLTISADSAQDLLVQLRTLAPISVPPAQVLTPAVDHVQPTTEAKLDKALDKAIDEVERSEKPKRGRPAKAAAAPAPVSQEHLFDATPAVLPDPVPPPVTPPQVHEVLFAEAKTALAEFVENDKEAGREKAIGLLKSLGAARLSDLDFAGLQKFLTLIKV